MTWVEFWKRAGVAAGFTNRDGGVSQFPFESLNLGLHVDDSRQAVLDNRSRLASDVGARPEAFVYARQVHGRTAVEVGQADRGRGVFAYDDAVEDADALVTAESGVVLTVLAADCVPVLLADLNGKVVGAAHAGWRGATSGIISTTVRMMTGVGVRPEDLHVAIGPAIRGCCYEVDLPVVNAAQDAYRRFVPGADLKLSPSTRTQDRYMLDIPSLIRDELDALGVKRDHVWDMEVCTHCDDHYFSHRREHGRTGRQGAFIYIMDQGGDNSGRVL